MPVSTRNPPGILWESCRNLHAIYSHLAEAQFLEDSWRIPGNPGRTARNPPGYVGQCKDLIPITNLFDAYDLQGNPLDEDKIRSQEVVNYCEARFRVALQAMMRRSEQDQQWMCKVLFREMVGFLLHDLDLTTADGTCLGIMFLIHQCRSCHWTTAEHSGHCQVTGPRYVLSRNDSTWIVPTRHRAHDISGWKSQYKWT